MNICNIKKEEIVSYCYGELDSRRKDEIKQHLAACNRCREEVQSLEKTILLVKQQKLKPIPKEILDNYTQEVKERLTVEEKSFVLALKERLFAWLENLRLGFSPRLVPVAAVLCIAIFVFAFMQYGKINNINLLNQDIALLDTLGEDADGLYLASGQTQLAEEIEISDRIILAQLDTDVETEEAFDDAEILQELGEEDLDEEESTDYLEIIDEMEVGSAVS